MWLSPFCSSVSFHFHVHLIVGCLCLLSNDCHHCSWEADNFFSSFPGPQVEKRFAPDGIYPESHSYLIYNMLFK